MRKTMKAKPTKVMASAITKSAKEAGLLGLTGCLESIEKREFGAEKYSWKVGSIWENYDDYNYSTGTYSVIVVTYKPEMYACERYLTSNDFYRILRHSDGSYDGFMSGVLEEIEI